MEDRQIQQLEELIGYRFNDRSLLIESFTHSSHADHRLKSNERLEFLGDAVLDLVICKALFDQFPDYLEGDLTKIKSMLVSRKTCAKIASQLDLPQFTRVGKGMDQTRAMEGSIAAGQLEAIIAAIYLDGGYDAAAKFIINSFEPLIVKADAKQHHENYKSMLQQFAQCQFGQTPAYQLLDEKGPDHDKCFEVGVNISDHTFPAAWGNTKKEAEQKAALNALVELRQIKSQ
ncbi:Ribonuclease 3 [Anaerohalosphaera lusitana]|uniref:Ribonuclease 3 n=1 Tax=Anaerohalosphaera lusitana TaxID=1936003 RepID=A0A1U9NLL6_9BACT|nr:ribonuclease III [Anaerohalosphaera lusitana]AQT68386.1 Ribonuclease 3 [Anaerohalosphaera lusitana]